MTSREMEIELERLRGISESQARRIDALVASCDALREEYAKLERSLEASLKDMRVLISVAGPVGPSLEVDPPPVPRILVEEGLAQPLPKKKPAEAEASP